jgi:predicted DNA-binding transcriptional regulator AlpA
MPDTPLPFTPRALTADLAALYCGMSRSAWDERVAKGKAPKPFYLDARPRWLREDLDTWLDAQAGRMPASAPNPWDAPPDAPRRAAAPRP